MSLSFVRTIRTSCSERFLIDSEPSQEGAVLDLHYLNNGNVIGTLIVLDAQLQTDERTQMLLKLIDERLLPMASLNEKNLAFTVVHGTLVGHFHNAEQE